MVSISRTELHSPSDLPALIDGLVVELLYCIETLNPETTWFSILVSRFWGSLARDATTEDISLVATALRERSHLRDNAPHKVRDARQPSSEALVSAL